MRMWTWPHLEYLTGGVRVARLTMEGRNVRHLERLLTAGAAVADGDLAAGELAGRIEAGLAEFHQEMAVTAALVGPIADGTARLRALNAAISGQLSRAAGQTIAPPPGGGGGVRHEMTALGDRVR